MYLLDTNILSVGAPGVNLKDFVPLILDVLISLERYPNSERIYRK